MRQADRIVAYEDDLMAVIEHAVDFDDGEAAFAAVFDGIFEQIREDPFH